MALFGELKKILIQNMIKCHRIEWYCKCWRNLYFFDSIMYTI